MDLLDLQINQFDRQFRDCYLSNIQLVAMGGSHLEFARKT